MGGEHIFWSLKHILNLLHLKILVNQDLQIIFFKFKKKKEASVKTSTTQSHSTSRWNSSQLNSPLGQYPMHSEEKYKCSFFSVLASWAEFLLGIKRNKYEWLSRRHTVKLPFITNIVCPCIMKHDQPRYQYKKYLSSIS